LDFVQQQGHVTQPRRPARAAAQQMNGEQAQVIFVGENANGKSNV
jgi:hypothetical protein